MPLAEIFALVKSGGDALNAINLEKIRKNWLILREMSARNPKSTEPHFLLSSANEFPLPSIATSTYVKRFNFGRGVLIIVTLLAVDLAAAALLAAWGPEDAWIGLLFFPPPCLLFALFVLLINRNSVFAIGDSGIIDKQGGQRWFIARWVDIQELRELPSPTGGYFEIELGDRTVHRPQLPGPARTEFARLVRQHLPSPKLVKAEHLIRLWELNT